MTRWAHLVEAFGGYQPTVRMMLNLAHALTGARGGIGYVGPQAQVVQHPGNLVTVWWYNPGSFAVEMLLAEGGYELRVRRSLPMNVELVARTLSRLGYRLVPGSAPSSNYRLFIIEKV